MAGTFLRGLKIRRLLSIGVRLLSATSIIALAGGTGCAETRGVSEVQGIEGDSSADARATQTVLTADEIERYLTGRRVVLRRGGGTVRRVRSVSYLMGPPAETVPYALPGMYPTWVVQVEGSFGMQPSIEVRVRPSIGLGEVGVSSSSTATLDLGDGKPLRVRGMSLGREGMKRFEGPGRLSPDLEYPNRGGDDAGATSSESND